MARRMGAKALAWALAAGCVFGSARAALGQEQLLGSAPPTNLSVDPRGVDLISGAYAPTITEISIGPQGNGGLAVTRSLIGNGWRESFIGTINSSGSTYTVSIGGASEAFTLSGSTYTPQDGSGSTLTPSGSNYVYTTADGTAFTFTPNMTTGGAGPYPASNGVLASMRRPDGEVVSYNYGIKVICTGGTGPKAAPAMDADAAGSSASASPSATCSGGERDYYRVASISNNLGYAISLTYEDAGTLPSIYTVVGMTAANSKSTIGGTPLPSVSLSGSTSNPRTLTDALGRVTSFSYDSTGHLLSYTRPGYAAITATYDGSRRVATWTDGVASYSYAYSVSGSTQTTTITTPTGTQVATSNTQLLELMSLKDELSHTTSYTYDLSHRVTQVTLPEGNAVAYAYDGRGNVTTTTQIPFASSGQANIVTTASYDATCTIPVKCNKPNATIDALGHETDYLYDPTHGGVTTITQPAPTSGAVRPQTRYGYTAFTPASGAVYRLTGTSACATQASCSGTADEVKSTLGYNANLQLSSITSGAGDGSLSAATSMSYDQVGNLYTTTNPIGAVTRYRYDADRELVGVVGPDPDGGGPQVPAAVRISYTIQGLVSETESGTVPSQSDGDWANFNSQIQTLYGYNSQGLKTSTTQSGAGYTVAKTQQSYDGADRLMCVAVRMNAATFGSEPASACNQGTAGSGGPDLITGYYNNPDSTIRSATDGYGTSLQRNAFNVTAFLANKLPYSVQDGKSNLTTFSRDGFDRLVQTAYPSPTTANQSNGGDYDGYGYDANGNVVTRHRRDNTTTTYVYDALNRMTQGVDGTTYAYDNLGRLTGSSYAGRTVGFAYDALGRVTRQTNGLGTIGYQYDLAGRRTRLTWPDGFWVGYVYDMAGNLTAVQDQGATSGPGLLASYGYDGLNRRSSAFLAGGQLVQGYGYDAISHLASVNYAFQDGSRNSTLTLDYDEAGRIQTKAFSNDLYTFGNFANTAVSYQLNGLNQISSLTLPASLAKTFNYDAKGNLTSDETTTYAYDDFNHLVSVASATLAYDPLGRLYSVYNASNSFTTQFLYDGSELIGEYDGSGNLLARYVHGSGVDNPIVSYTGTNVATRTWLLADEHGSIIAQATQAGGLLNANTYDEYGVPGPANAGRFQYAGQAWLTSVGMYYDKARFYSPTLGRFLQTDPIGYADGLNWYNYVHSDPVNNTDPTGLQEQVVTKPQNGLPSGQTLPEVVVTGSQDFNPPTTIPEPPSQTSPPSGLQGSSTPGNPAGDMDGGGGGGRGGRGGMQGNTVGEVVVTRQRLQLAAISPEEEEAIAAQAAEIIDAEIEEGEELLGFEKNRSGKSTPQNRGRPNNPAVQNKQVRDAAREADLNQSQTGQLGREIEILSRAYGEALSYQDILLEARFIKGR